MFFWSIVCWWGKKSWYSVGGVKIILNQNLWIWKGKKKKITHYLSVWITVNQVEATLNKLNLCYFNWWNVWIVLFSVLVLIVVVFGEVVALFGFEYPDVIERKNLRKKDLKNYFCTGIDLHSKHWENGDIFPSPCRKEQILAVGIKSFITFFIFLPPCPTSSLDEFGSLPLIASLCAVCSRLWIQINPFDK